MGMLRLLFALLVACGFLSIQIATASTVIQLAPDLEYNSKARSLGRFIYVSYTIVNTGFEGVPNAVIRMGLPHSYPLLVRHASVFPSPKGMERVKLQDAVYWLNVEVPAKRRRKFTLKLEALGCLSSQLEFKSFTYFVSANGTTQNPTGETATSVRFSNSIH